MQEEIRILELLAEVLHRQDQTKEQLQRISNEIGEVKQNVAE
ncbi:MAG: hypothetical protein ACRYFK_15880 [Janthinobacterium lividum]